MVISFLYVAVTRYQTKINNVLRIDRIYQKNTEVNLLPKNDKLHLDYHDQLIFIISS